MKKDLMIAVLLTFCLTATMFMIATTKSQEYNPWADLNEDGKIDILDLTGVTGIYGMSGDPTKNVNVTNWPTQQPQPKAIMLLAEATLTFEGEPTLTFFASVNVTGYRYVSIFITYSSDANRSLQLWPSCLGTKTYDGVEISLPQIYPSWHQTSLKAYEVNSPTLDLAFYSSGAGTLYITATLYCYN